LSYVVFVESDHAFMVFLPKQLYSNTNTQKLQHFYEKISLFDVLAEIIHLFLYIKHKNSP